ncbi:MAG TPA: flagellar biosynthetic protein FliR [Chromatiaceae bacterium]|nr:flagellar biosynthetic protein FliR [Chromatiaceae bacterium]
MLHFSGMELMTWTGSLLWPFIRIGAMFVSAPIFSASSLPVRIRVVLALLVAWLLLPVLPAPPVVDLLSADAFLISIYQVLIGVAMGFILQMVFAVFIIAGQSIAMGMGLGFASAVDPQNGVQVPVISQSLLIMITLIFLSLNGHLLFMELMAESFELLPVGVIHPDPGQLWQLVVWGGYMFAGGVLVAIPAVAGLLLVNIAFGVASRAAPQLNIFAVGFPVMIMAGFVLIIQVMPSLTSHLSTLLFDAVTLIRQLLVL